mmetsp:Transcript_2409/g.3401  ORF Transcript_2409/g.3401 Transcript_2409/m.3401 type:complete len:218 (+) Transcript_2409:369-1022(+)
MEKQGRMLFNTFRVVSTITGSDKKKILPKLTKLIERHTFEYNVHPVYYSYFCEAMLKALKIVHGKMFNAEMEYAWVTSISHLMQLIIPLAVQSWKEKLKRNNGVKENSGLKLANPISPTSWLMATNNKYSSDHIAAVSVSSMPRISPNREKASIGEMFDQQKKWSFVYEGLGNAEKGGFEIKKEENSSQLALTIAPASGLGRQFQSKSHKTIFVTKI